ncbi:MAG TPA: DUF2306 domain-containing protein [Quisquiliibacterium sp.]|nr:DUF2306 domain-containing protein [Quisquiliibacterium sp.]HQD83246.1 DUF2306 domain-containing protein [Quisquiliibacterium sp.]HQN13345.1 DUF2306 domain-containing protein [Quisquiliibacterium sp.]
MSPIVAVHALSAVAACLLGAWQLIALRRGLRHRRVGYAWMLAMLVTALSSFGLRSPLGFAWLGGLSPIHGLSLFTLLSIALAIRYARRRAFAQHRRWVVGAYAGLLGAGVFAVALPDRAMHRMLFTDLPGVLAAAF